MAIQTKNSTETTKFSRAQPYCCGMEEYQNHLLTGRVEILGKYKVFIQKEKLKIWDDEIKVITQHKTLANNKYLGTKTTENLTD